MKPGARFTRRAALMAVAVPLRATAARPRFEQIDLFRQGEAGVHTYRIPALAETRNGVLIAVADARHDSSHDLPGRISLVARRSLDHGATWSPARTMREVKEGGVGDASLLFDGKTGRLWCFHAYGPPGVGFGTKGAGNLRVHAMSSDDDAQTWSQPADLTAQVKQPDWHNLFATSGTHFRTTRGRYLVPLVVRDSSGAVASCNMYSDDAGRTWKAGVPIGAGTDESKAVELAGGVILQNMRNGTTRAIARSHDGGVTFDGMTHDPALIDPSCNAGIARFRHGRRDAVVFTNAASTRRENLTVKLSYDGAKTWPVARTLHPGPAAYSTVVPLRDGTLAVLYERGESFPAERITFARFDPEWCSG